MNHINFHNDTVHLNEIWYQSHKTLIEKIAIELEAIDKIDELTRKFLGDKQKLKKMTDPLKPKRCKSAYLFFCERNRNKIKNENPNIKIGELMKKMGESWRNISENDKKEFIDLHLIDKDRYDDDMEEYKKNN